MKNYELTYLISSELSEEEAKNLYQKIDSFIQEEGGVLGNKEKMVLRKKLAYPIKKQTQAYLVVSIFQLEPEKLANLEKKIKLENQVLRYLILTRKPAKEIVVKLRRRPKLVTEKPVVARKVPEKKVELKEIEKKLEEILKVDET